MRRALPVLIAGLLLVGGAACSSDSKGTSGKGTTVPASGPGVAVIVLTPARKLSSADADAAAAIVRDRLKLSLPASVEVVKAGKGLEARIKGADKAQLAEMVASVRLRGVVELRPVVRPLGRHERAGLPSVDGEVRYEVGPVAVRGTDFATAQAQLNSSWEVEVRLESAARARAARLFDGCFTAQSTCPAKQVAVVVDGVVQSAPTVLALGLADNPFVIDGSFTRVEAHALAIALRTRPLPAAFTVTQR